MYTSSKYIIAPIIILFVTSELMAKRIHFV